MSKHGWTYKKLGNLCVIFDSQRKPVTKHQRTHGSIPYYGANGIQDYVADYIFDGRYLLIGEDGAKWTANEKSSFIIEGKSWVNNHAHILKTNEELSDLFLMYYLNNRDLSSYITGTIVPKLTQAALRAIDIPVPGMAEQEAIVAELDEINEAIAALQQQVADLDTLAKATFYEMFGDPVTNPHSWPVKKLGDVATSKIGLTYKPTDVNNDGIVVLRSSNIQNSIIDLNDIVRVQAKVPPEKIVRPNDILMCTRNGSFRLVGKVALISNIDEEMTYGAFMTVIRSNYYHYLFQYFKSPSYRLQLGSAKTTTINQITVKMLNELSLPIPPLALQREFAERVEAIEAAKAELSAQIAELQTLLASRMDFWFAPNQPGDP